MKTTLLLFLLALSLQTVKAATWIVDNNVNSPQPISSVQDAIDNYAKDSDTIMVEGSPNSYGDFIVTKSLTIIGEGSHDSLGENALAGTITIRASNVLITGFNWALGQPAGLTFDAAGANPQSLSNITIERCDRYGLNFIGAGTNSTFHNIFIRNNIIHASVRSGQVSGFTTDTLIFENNICPEFRFEGWGTNVTNSNTIFIRNNIFIWGSQSGSTLFFDDFLRYKSYRCNRLKQHFFIQPAHKDAITALL